MKQRNDFFETFIEQWMELFMESADLQKGIQNVVEAVLEDVFKELREEEKRLMRKEKLQRVAVFDELNELAEITRRLKNHFGYKPKQ